MNSSIAEIPSDAQPRHASAIQRFAERFRGLSDRRLAIVLVLCLIGVYWSTMGGHTYSIDDETYLAGAKSLVHRTTVMQPTPDIASTISLVPHKNGLGTTAAPVGTLALFAPGVVAGKVFSMAFDGQSREEAQRLIYLATNSVLTAVTAGLLFLLTLRLGASRRVGLLLSIAYSLGSWAWPHSKTGFSEPGTTLMVTGSILLLVKHWQTPTRWSPYWVGFLAGCSVLTRSSTLVFVPILGLACLAGLGRINLRRTVATGAIFGIGVFGPILVLVANSWLRFGKLFDSGYPAAVLNFTTPPAEGVFGLFLSPGKGLLWYAPICIVAVFGLRFSYNLQRRYTVTVLVLTLAHLAIYARFEFWSGEAAYGPRYLLPLLPAFIALLSPVLALGRHWMRGAMLATAVGIVFVGLLGGSMYFNAVYSRNIPQVASEIWETEPGREEIYMAWQFYPRTSQMALYVRSVPQLINTISDRFADRDDGIGPIPAEYATRIFWYNNAIEPDYWWAWWARRGDSPLAYSLLIVPVLLWVGAWQILRSGRAKAARSEALPVSEGSVA